MSLVSLCYKYKRPLCFIVFLILAFILFHLSDSIKEGLDIDWTKLTPVTTSCVTNGKTCATCTNSYFRGSSTADNVRCAWNSDSSAGGSCETSSSSTPIGYFTCPSSEPIIKSGCTPCAKTVLLDTPTFMSV